MSPRSPRPVRLLGAALTLALVAAACGGSSDEDETPAESTSALVPAAEGNVEYPLTLDTAFGEITLEERPERIVAGDDFEIDLLAALGVTPVGTNDQDIFRLYATKDLQPIESTWSTDEVAYPAEAILATEPDLIDVVGAFEEPDNYDELSKIAPVLGAETIGDETVPWEDRLRQLATALDLTDRAAQVITENDEYFEQVRADHPEFEGQTVAFLNIYGADYGIGYMNYPGEGSTRLFDQMGFAENPDSARFADVDTVSDELLGSIEADVIMIVDSGEDGALEDLQENPLFQSLDAVEADRVVVVSNPEQRDIVQPDGTVVAEGFGHLGRALGGSGPVPQQAITEFMAPLLSDVLN